MTFETPKMDDKDRGSPWDGWRWDRGREGRWGRDGWWMMDDGQMEMRRLDRSMSSQSRFSEIYPEHSCLRQEIIQGWPNCVMADITCATWESGAFPPLALIGPCFVYPPGTNQIRAIHQSIDDELENNLTFNFHLFLLLPLPLPSLHLLLHLLLLFYLDHWCLFFFFSLSFTLIVHNAWWSMSRLPVPRLFTFSPQPLP